MEGKLTITQQLTLDSIPSGSGIAVKDGTAYVVGDDATSIYLLNLESRQHASIPIPGFDPAVYREPKPVKHDFESAAFIDWNGTNYLLAIGSGSKVGTRDSLMLLNIANPADRRIYSLAGLYGHMRSQTKCDFAHWNMEGVAVAGEKLVLANRGNNSLFIFELNEFMQWLGSDMADFPPFENQMLQLPQIQGKQARISGICTNGNTELLFCASVEDTPDWISDGPVLGSFIGSYSIPRNAVTSAHLLKDGNDKPLLEKIESLDVLKHQGRTTDIIAIADNDNGTSRIFLLQLTSSSSK